MCHCRGLDSRETFVDVSTEDYNKVWATGNTQEQEGQEKKKKAYWKVPAQFWDKILWTVETKMNLFLNARKINSSWSKACHIICWTWWRQCYGWTWMSASGTGSLVLIEGCWSKKQDEFWTMYRALLSAHIQLSAPKLIGQHLGADG